MVRSPSPSTTLDERAGEFTLSAAEMMSEKVRRRWQTNQLDPLVPLSPAFGGVECVWMWNKR